MKDFLKYTLATVVGLILASIALFFISMLTLFGMASASESETQVEENSVMMLNLNGTLNERNQEMPLQFLLQRNELSSYGLDDILSSVRKAKENEKIKGIYLQCNMLACGHASLQEIRNALEDFKSSGKFVVAYADQYLQGMYYLASVADKVMLNPKGGVDWRGVASTRTFYKDLLEKVGVEMQVFKVGTYKSAVEPYMLNEMSDANREQVECYIGSIWDEMTAAVAQSRHLTVEQLQQAADRMMLFETAEENVKVGLADTLIYKSDVKKYLKQLVGIEEDDKLHVLDLQAMINVKKSVPRDKSGNIIAIYYAFGGIDDSSSSSFDEGIQSAKVVKDLRLLEEDEDVKAVVLRVNSPGGSAYGSEQIWYAVKQLKEKKPVIVSMGDYAASGGYYISCNADTIVAEPTTLTGSIGIFGMFPNASKLMNDKIGLHTSTVKTNRFSDFGDISRPMNADEKAVMQQYINRGYDLFLTRCSEGRGIDKATMDGIAQGRVWTGAKALELGLVDVLGGIDKALEIAIDKAGVEAYTVMSYPEKSNFMDQLLKGNIGDLLIRSYLGRSSFGPLMEQIRFVEQLEGVDPIQARLPFELNIH